MLPDLKLTKKEILEYFGSIKNIAGATKYKYMEGKSKDVNTIMVKTGSGLDFEVITDRGMDIALADYNSIPISWVSKTGIVSPYFYESYDMDFLRSFFGGLLTTCGLTNAGLPCEVSGFEINERLGLHGRISHIPAESVSIDEYWEENDYIIKVKGILRESCVYEENLVLKREIICKLGEPKIHIHDIVENAGFNRTPLMVLYHLNFGFPIVSADSRLYTSYKKVLPYNDHAKNSKEAYDAFKKPVADFKPENYIFLEPKNKSVSMVALINHKINLGVSIEFDPEQLPFLTNWNMTGKQDYVVGIEPGNCYPEGSVNAEKNNRLEVMGPNETKEIDIKIGIIEGIKEIDKFVDNIKSM